MSGQRVGRGEYHALTVLAVVGAVGLFVAADGVAAFPAVPPSSSPSLSTSVLPGPAIHPMGSDPEPRGPSVVATVPVGYGPQDLAYDPANGEVFVAGTDAVSVINDTIDAVVSTNPFGAGDNGLTQGVAYDPGQDEVFVANTGGGVAVINATSDTVVTRIPVGSEPVGVAYDPAQGEVFVTNACVPVGSSCAGAVSVINATSDAVVAMTFVGSVPWGAVYDAGRGEVFVSNYESSSVSVINTTSDAVVATIPLCCLAYPEGLTYDPAQGEVFVANFGWSDVAVINDSEDAVTAVVPFGSSGPLGSGPQGVVYDPASGEVFATASLPGRVVVISTSTDKVVGSVRVGSTPVGVAYDSGKGEVFVTNDGPSLRGAPYVSILSYVRSSYPVKFHERNLPPGTEWWVNVTGSPSVTSTGVALVIYEPPGSYSYVVGTENKTWAGRPGTFTLGKSLDSQPVKFVRQTFPVTFGETGLPSGARWCVAFSGGRAHCTAKALLSFLDPNGTYDYTLTTTKPGYSAPGGSFTVAGMAVSATATFSA